MLTSLIILGLASSTVSVTVGSSQLLKPARNWIGRHSEFLGDLISCPYCLGHWVAAGIMFSAGEPSLIQWLSITALSAIFSGLITRLFGE